MACLILFPDDPAKQSIHFLRASANAIGSDASNHIKLLEPSISPFHALITSQHQGEYCEIIDLHSDSGTQVNGRPVLRCILKHSDQLMIGNIPAAYYKIPPERTFRSAFQDVIPPLDQDNIEENIQFITTPMEAYHPMGAAMPSSESIQFITTPQIKTPTQAITTLSSAFTPPADEMPLMELDHQVQEANQKLEELKQELAQLEAKCLAYGLGPDANQTRHNPESSALMLFCHELIRALDMFESFKKHSEEAQLPPSILNQFQVFQESLFKILERRSIRTMSIPPGSVVDVQMRHKIIVIDRVEQGRSENEPPKVLETLKPGYIYSDAQNQDIVLRKPEVVISA